MNITEFLLARITEDEAVANECLLPKNLHPYGDERIPAIGPSEWGDLAKNYLGGEMGEHCANWNPARVLAECAAKRAIIAAATSWQHEFNPSAWYACRAYKLKEGAWKILKISEGKCNCGVTRQRSSILKPLAAVYKDHPDYRPEWA